jgi:hypothetical protein
MSDVITWTPCTAELGDLKPWERNPKTISKAHAKRLLANWQKLGQWQTIAIGPACEVYDGHQRLSVLLAAYGTKYEIKALQSDRPLTDDERGQIVFEGTVGSVGQIDWEQVSGFDASALAGWGLDADTLRDWKRDTSALDNFIKSEQVEPVDAEPQVDRAEELREKWQTETGQLWAIGEHRLICGDCTDAAVVARVMGGERARLEFSDPPYEIDTQGGGVMKQSGHLQKITDAGIDKFSPLLLEKIAETSIFCCNKPLIPDYIKLAENWSSAWDLCFWKKNNTPPNYGGHMMTDTEYLPLLGNQSPNSGLEKDIYSKLFISDIVDDRLVGWQKPILLIDKFIKLFSFTGDIIIDRFTCTGTTGIACQNLGRKARMIEISPAYCAVILERFSTAFPDLIIKRIE